MFVSSVLLRTEQKGNLKRTVLPAPDAPMIEVLPSGTSPKESAFASV